MTAQQYADECGQPPIAGTGNGQDTMNSQMLRDTVKLLFADNKGLLAMDESTGTCNAFKNIFKWAHALPNGAR